MERLRYLIGIATLAAVVAGGWFLLALLADDDRSGLFSLRLEFRNVRGLKDGADVKYRGVRVGSVRAIELSNDGERGLVTVLLDEGVERLARQGSMFWVVSPRFSGLTAGATGLDTLVRDSYIAFVTPDLERLPLAHGSLISGLERPFGSSGEQSLDPVRRGDLQMSLLVPENHGLAVGAEVRFRGIMTGQVRSVELAADGTHVNVGLLIRQRYRKTVTERSEFWIARPRLSGALLSGLAVEDLSALLAPFVGYHTESGRGVPVADGYRVATSDERPDVGTTVPKDALTQVVKPVNPNGDEQKIRLVQVIYEAEESDWLSANDRVSRKGTGVLFTDGQGRTVVVTARSLCDASYFLDDTLGTEPDIKSEAIRVAIPGGSVLRAGRSWVDSDGADLAILVVDDAPPDLPVTRPERFLFDGTDLGAGASLLDFARTDPVTITELARIEIAERRGDAVLRADKIVGILGQADGHDETVTLVNLSRLPTELRPDS